MEIPNRSTVAKNTKIASSLQLKKNERVMGKKTSRSNLLPGKKKNEHAPH